MVRAAESDNERTLRIESRAPHRRHHRLSATHVEGDLLEARRRLLL